MRAPSVLLAFAVLAIPGARLAGAKPAAAPARLAALAPPTTDDALRAVAIGPDGEVYEPDGKGAWIRTQRITTADPIAIVGRADGAVIANAGGAVYRLAPNGWSALRLVQQGKAITSGGSNAIAAVGRQLFALDRMERGEPAKLAVAPADVLAIAGAQVAKPGAKLPSYVVATDKGLLRPDKTGKLVAIAGAPKRVNRLVSDVWAITDKGALDLRTNKPVAWPAGTTITLATPGPADSLVVVATIAKQPELVVVRAGKLERAPLAITPPSAPVGVAVDRAGRAVVALRDGRLLVRDKAGAWTTTEVKDALPADKPGPPPATSR
ncbi:MAG TPA: hypothetical protein VFQ53_28355 [Kofleriaceae bacterium]|nr:hypothetical protein [Kofleriaceae bacterium]